MHIEFIIAIILFRYLETHDYSKTLDPKWKKNFRTGFFFSIGLLVLGVTGGFMRNAAIWVTHIILLGLMYFLANKGRI